MILSSPLDYREAARRRLPRFLFDYVDGGAFGEETMAANRADLSAIRLRQRVLRDVSAPSLETSLFGERMAMPVLLAPIGLGGMMRRRGEVQVARAACRADIPYILSTVSVCSAAEVTQSCGRPVWFQLYVLKDRGFMRHALERAQALGATKLVFTVDMPVPGARYRDAHSGMSGPHAPLRRMMQAVGRPGWAWDVGLRGRPHDLGNITDYRGQPTSLTDYIGWLGANFDPAITWRDLEWIRDFWKGEMIVKGLLDPDDARDAVRFGADGIIVSNHGGRQLDGALSTARALPAIVDAVGDALTVLVDGGIRTGLDVVRMLALGARGVLLGRAYIYALAARGEQGVTHLLNLIAQGMTVSMALNGVRSVGEIDRSSLT
ncbi:FMN-dependent L-lactate dehydrogenase LldD [Sphingobium aromaticiconvertens]|uniref:FMN-dependent L-lactate dehydrogenase LldD n=1 Tax=Sphingobium aromaticiconvertens TaxID=365341 RepID=UPI00301651CB